MRGDTEDAGTRLRDAGWRQGAILDASDIGELGIGRDECAIILSQDCDVVQAASLEPEVELIVGQMSDRPRPDCLYGRNPRHLDLELTGRGGATSIVVSLRVRNRRIVSKEDLARFRPSEALMLDEGQVRLLTRWVARRYTRPAWPDAFNERLRAIDGKLDQLCKSAVSRAITGIWIDLDPPTAELSQDEVYRMVVWLSTERGTRADAAAYQSAQEFESRLEKLLESCPGLELTELELRDESDITLDDLRRLRRLDRDYRSLAPKPGGSTPPPET